MDPLIEKKAAVIICIVIPWLSVFSFWGKLFVKSKIALPLLAALAGLGVICVALGLHGSLSTKLTLAGVVPLYQIALLRVCYLFFNKIMDRDPESMAFNWESEKVLDRGFAFTVLLLGCLIPLIVTSNL